MKVEAVALMDFVHGEIHATEGKVVRRPNGDLIEHGVAGDLERAGRVRIRTMTTRPPVIEGKASDDGRGQPSSASHQAPASPTLTSTLFKRGSAKPPKNDA